jgi:hypothetical protein
MALAADRADLVGPDRVLGGGQADSDAAKA